MPNISSLFTFIGRPIGASLRAVVKAGSGYQVFTAKKQACALRPAYHFTAREGHQVEADFLELKQIFYRRYICCGI
jgi:hypothetical protein